MRRDIRRVVGLLGDTLVRQEGQEVSTRGGAHRQPPLLHDAAKAVDRALLRR